MDNAGGSAWGDHGNVEGQSQALGVFMGSTAKSLEMVTEGLRQMRDDFKAFVLAMESYKTSQGSNAEMKSDLADVKGRLTLLEKWQIGFTAKLSVYSGLSGAAGAGVVMVIAHYWK